MLKHDKMPDFRLHKIPIEIYNSEKSTHVYLYMLHIYTHIVAVLGWSHFNTSVIGEKWKPPIDCVHNEGWSWATGAADKTKSPCTHWVQGVTLVWAWTTCLPLQPWASSIYHIPAGMLVQGFICLSKWNLFLLGLMKLWPEQRRGWLVLPACYRSLRSLCVLQDGASIMVRPGCGLGYCM